MRRYLLKSTFSFASVAGEIATRRTTSNTGWTIRERLQEMGINGLCDRGYEISLGSVQHEEAYARETEDSPCEHYATHIRVDGVRACEDCGELVE